MEAIVRLALMVALPTDAMIAAVGAEDAGQYIMELRSNPEDLREFIQDNKRQWYQVNKRAKSSPSMKQAYAQPSSLTHTPPLPSLPCPTSWICYQEPTQQVGRCVDHLLALITRVVELNTRGAKDMVVTRDEAREFARMSRSKRVMSVAGREEGVFRAALNLVKERLLAALAQVKSSQASKQAAHIYRAAAALLTTPPLLLRSTHTQTGACLRRPHKRSVGINARPHVGRALPQERLPNRARCARP